MILGMLFAYFVSLPAALKFLGGFSSGEIKSLISTNEYFSFVTGYLIGFGLLFQLPLIMVFINKIVRLDFKKLMKLERWVILVAFIIAAILTPTPDFVNQTIMAVPIILLYQISALMIWFINRSNFYNVT
jgi:sec-independent protein translocase protein TatC